MSKEIGAQKSKDEKTDADSQNIVSQKALMDEDLDGVTGGRSAFADVPRVPLRDYDEEIKSKV